jgi:hypothetical protein
MLLTTTGYPRYPALAIRVKLQPAMATYQVHILDVFGRIVRTVEVECDGDDQARALAEDQSRLVSTELWQDDRLIERYDSVL